MTDKVGILPDNQTPPHVSDKKPPAMDKKPPASDEKLLASDEKLPVSDGKLPASDEKPPEKAKDSEKQGHVHDENDGCDENSK